MTGQLTTPKGREEQGVHWGRTTAHPWPLHARVGKRAFDVVVSTAALATTWPLILAGAVAVRLDSPGPAFFLQERMGLRGRRFRLIKLRGMFIDAPERFPHLYSYSDSASARSYEEFFPAARDPRVTRVGRVLRKGSIDELPNFVNVLLGHMSVVGPRPEIPEVAGRYGDSLGRLLSVKPGVTSPAKARGRGALGFEETLALELAYIEQRTFWLDVKTVTQTATSLWRSPAPRIAPPVATEEAELDRIRRAYRRYSEHPAERRRRDRGNAGLATLRAEWHARLAQRVALKGISLAEARVLDLGCGDGELLASLVDRGVARERCVGVELMQERRDMAAGRLPGSRILHANAASVPLEPSSFDVVCLSMVLSSVQDAELSAKICREAARLVGPSGVVVVYDTRYPNPANPDVRAITRRELRRLFPGFAMDAQPLSLLPPLARALNGRAAWLYPLLSVIPPLRARYLTILTAPSSEAPA